MLYVDHLIHIHASLKDIFFLFLFKAQYLLRGRHEYVQFRCISFQEWIYFIYIYIYIYIIRRTRCMHRSTHTAEREIGPSDELLIIKG